MQLVECVPNFSEGRDHQVIEAIAESIRPVDGVRLLHMDSNADANRTVMTFAGPPDVIGQAAFLVIQKATELIDMSKQQGAHPRLGAVDVCPFVPLVQTTEHACIQIAIEVACKTGEMGIPVYLYGAAAIQKERAELSTIRNGEYEGLAGKIRLPQWAPDFGPRRLHPTAGAMVTGVRNILVAYNVNLNTEDVTIANRIAQKIRTSGYKKEGKQIPGALPACKAIGWHMPGHHCAQVSTNLTDYKLSPPHIVYDLCRKIAQEFGADVTGSELIGLIPLDCMLEAGRYFLIQNNGSIGTEDEIIQAAVNGLGLDQLAPFNPAQRILEYVLKNAGL